jgi:hypothetical protein
MPEGVSSSWDPHPLNRFVHELWRLPALCALEVTQDFCPLLRGVDPDEWLEDVRKVFPAVEVAWYEMRRG